MWHLESSGCNYDDFDAHRRLPHTLDEPAVNPGFAAEHVLVVELGGRDMVNRVLQSATLMNQNLGLKEATVSFTEGARGYAACDFDISIFDQRLLGKKYGVVWQQLMHIQSLPLSTWPSQKKHQKFDTRSCCQHMKMKVTACDGSMFTKPQSAASLPSCQPKMLTCWKTRWWLY